MTVVSEFVQVPRKDWESLQRQLRLARDNATIAANKVVKINKNEDWLMKKILRLSHWLNDMIHKYNKEKWDREFERALKIYSQ